MARRNLHTPHPKPSNPDQLIDRSIDRFGHRQYNQSLRGLRQHFAFDADAYWDFIRDGTERFLSPDPQARACVRVRRACVYVCVHCVRRGTVSRWRARRRAGVSDCVCLTSSS